jgi:hypothetical protein
LFIETKSLINQAANNADVSINCTLRASHLKSATYKFGLQLRTKKLADSTKAQDAKGSKAVVHPCAWPTLPNRSKI